ncbi:hypothetical protein HBE96_10675 [Clostridium sp. P21]|uniref:Calcineurin-like phosphoesterase domain-containing protein n=1 Tax=Clostridium muellerianum TaxID=2716538 RepID=A0A7Y0HNZ2_9CLOT|nr:hypothetical protein [Clostridium muellerianum]
MNDDCLKILFDNCLNLRLNDLGNIILSYRSRQERFKERFSIIFMGDTHINKTCGEEKVTNLEKYSRLLKKAMQCENVLCIIHGGDGTNNGTKEGLMKFANKTKEILYKDTVKEDYIPFFMNIGNHEYTNSTASEINYIELIGRTNQIISLIPQKLSIILLNTGCKSDGFFNKHSYFKKELNKIEDYINETDAHVNFLIDMHIPPSMGELEDKDHKNKTPHSLNCIFTNNFNEFIDIYSSKIIAIVTHHLHCFYQKNTCAPVVKYGNIPFYLTANAGHCTFCENRIYPSEFLKFDFQLNGDLDRELKIINVNRIRL